MQRTVSLVATSDGRSLYLSARSLSSAPIAGLGPGLGPVPPSALLHVVATDGLLAWRTPEEGVRPQHASADVAHRCLSGGDGVLTNGAPACLASADDAGNLRVEWRWEDDEEEVSLTDFVVVDRVRESQRAGAVAEVLGAMFEEATLATRIRSSIGLLSGAVQELANAPVLQPKTGEELERERERLLMGFVGVLNEHRAEIRSLRQQLGLDKEKKAATDDDVFAAPKPPSPDPFDGLPGVDDYKDEYEEDGNAGTHERMTDDMLGGSGFAIGGDDDRSLPARRARDSQDEDDDDDGMRPSTYMP